MEKEGERVRVSESPKIEYDLCVCVFARALDYRDFEYAWQVISHMDDYYVPLTLIPIYMKHSIDWIHKTILRQIQVYFCKSL